LSKPTNANVLTAGLVSLLAIVCGLPGLNANAIEIATRLKSTANFFDAEPQDSIALFGIDTAYGINLDARVTLSNSNTSTWSWEIAGELTSLQGDVIENAALFGGQSSGEALTLISDDLRAVNLTETLSSGSRHAAVVRLDRAQLAWQRGNVSARIGRQALSLGSGIVFNPMDLFNPFGPTAVDRDFKDGVDALVVSYVGDTGAELEFISVARTAAGNRRISANQGSYGLRYRAATPSLEYELIAAQHFDDQVLLASVSGPLGGAAWRANWVGTWHDNEFTQSAVANVDFAFGVGEQTGYLFGEYYFNGFGDSQAAEDPTRLDLAATERLARGELFVLERNYFALGGSVTLSARTTLTTTAIFSLDDGAPLLQSALSFAPGDNQTIEVGIIEATGGRGDEFGGIVLEPTTPVLTGTSRQIYARLVWFL